MSNKSINALEQQMDRAETYDCWADLAREHDTLTGMDRWRKREQSDDYDYHEISMRLQRLKQLLGRNDDEGLLFTLNEGIHGNMGGMGNPMLYHRAKFGTKQLITDYIESLADAVERVLSEESSIPLAEKADFVQRASHCFGRSALMLSGAGNLGMFHVGVVKALRETNVLPHIISGSSAGAMVAACLGCHTEDKLDDLLSTQMFSALVEQHEQQPLPGESSLTKRLLFGDAGPIDEDYLDELLDRLIDDMTFAEAFELTGREINISVSPQERHQTPRLLNAITSPNVMIRSAVRASCAIPGVFHAVTLEAKSAHGDRIPYLPSRKWVDGSVVGDLPSKRLARLYGVNHFVVSQANPLVLWGKSDPKTEHGLGANLLRFFKRATREGFNTSFKLTRRQLKRVPNLSYAANTMFSVLNQSYNGDVNIYPDFRFFDPRLLLKQLSDEEAQSLVENGMRATWPKIEMIKNCMRLSALLDNALHEFGNDCNELLQPRSAHMAVQQKKSHSGNRAA